MLSCVFLSLKVSTILDLRESAVNPLASHHLLLIGHRAGHAIRVHLRVEWLDNL